MRRTKMMILAVIGLSVLIVYGCGGGGGTAPASNVAPVADAGADKSVTKDLAVNFDGGGSTDTNGDTLGFVWSIVNTPIGSTATLSNSTAAIATLIPDVVGQYTIQLVVNDGMLDSSADTMVVSVFTPIGTLPGTGQTGDYTATFGEDSDYIINPPSYNDNGDGTVTDNVTGLMWQQQDDDVTYNWYEATGTADTTYNPSGATDVCGSLRTVGYTDWRLPTVQELQLIADYGENFPTIDQTFFPNTNVIDINGFYEYYWSSTFKPSNPAHAWFVEFAFGGVYTNANFTTKYVRCVRGGQSSFGNFTDNGDGTITDGITSLVWQKQDDDTTRTWDSALSYCEGLNLASAQDWRLPDIKELKSILDSTVDFPAIDQTFFPGNKTTSDWLFWSSTTAPSNPGNALPVGVYHGYVFNGFSKTGIDVYVRCVR